MKNTYKVYLNSQNGNTYYYGMIQARRRRDAQEIGKKIAKLDCAASFASAQPAINESINGLHVDILVNRLREIRESLTEDINRANERRDRITKTLNRI